jgi:hypothetical protein
MKKITLISAMACAVIATGCHANKQIPLVYDRESTATEVVIPANPSAYFNATLPDPFAFTFVNHARSNKFKDWELHRGEIISMLKRYEIGEKPTVDKKDIDAKLINDTLFVTVHANGETLNLKAFIKYPKNKRDKYPAVIGIGMPSGSLPPKIFDDRDIAQIAFNFTQVMSHTQKRGSEPINRLYPEYVDMGAYAAWPWGVSRIIDALEILADQTHIDTSHLAVTGCSFAGKMALFSGALDERIALTIAQEPGGGGVNAWRVSETLGDIERIHNTSYAWFKESMRDFSNENVSKLPLDHHQLAALVAPRALLVLGNPDYKWLGDESGYVSCHAARAVWEAFGVADRMGYSIQGGHGHCMLPQEQYPEVEAFVDRFLLDKNVDTNITRADMFQNVDYQKWMPWLK